MDSKRKEMVMLMVMVQTTNHKFNGHERETNKSSTNLKSLSDIAYVLRAFYAVPLLVGANDSTRHYERKGQKGRVGSHQLDRFFAAHRAHRVPNVDH